jgi:peptide deformylase
MPSPPCPLPLLTVGHPLLTQPAAPVHWPDSALPGHLAALHATLADFRARHGFGRALAAPQAGVALRIVVMNLGAGPFALINPEIIERSSDTFEVWDDCLSLPDRVVRVRRHCRVTVRYQNEFGQGRRWQADAPELSELLQHELDHLDGVLMTERACGSDAMRPIAEHAALVGAARPQHRLSLQNIVRSAQVIAPEFLQSAQYDCEPLSQALGCRLTLKVETLNPIRSFKGRGASFLVHELVARGDTRPWVCASAGNWGQALAWACRAAGRPLVVYAAVNANPLKVQRMRGFGAEVRLEGQDFDAAKDAARAFAQRGGGLMLEDGLQPEISEGHGTLAMELLADARRRGTEFDQVAVPLGNGALLNGMARWIKAASPATQVLGVSARGAPAMAQSWQQQRIVETDRADTLADGIAVRVPIPEAVADMQGQIDDVLLIDDSHLERALQLVWQHAGLMLEPAGAVGVAALVAHPHRFAGRQVATVLCGSNFLPQHVALAQA